LTDIINVTIQFDGMSISF